jgi:hypothetical protein
MLFYTRRGVAQPGSAPAWGAGGRQFKSGRPDHQADFIAGSALKAAWGRPFSIEVTQKATQEPVRSSMNQRRASVA